MAHSIKKKNENIQAFLKALDKSEKPQPGDTNHLLHKVNHENPSIKAQFDMRDDDGYRLFWDAFYSIAVHAGPVDGEGGQPQTSHAYLCCCC